MLSGRLYEYLAITISLFYITMIKVPGTTYLNQERIIFTHGYIGFSL